MLFTDVQGSTALLHQLGEAYGAVLDEHDRILRGVWTEFGGVEVDNEGDAFFVAFTDHARAIEAAAAAQRRLAAAAWPDGVQVMVRMALHSGEPAIRGHKYWGVDVHYAARLGSAAQGGQVVLSADMRSQLSQVQVESLGRHAVKDFPVARELFHLVVEGSRAKDFPPPRTLAATRSTLPTIDTPIIGREEVIDDLRSRLLTSSHLVTLIGPGGVGKTRTAVAVGESLVDEFPDGVGFAALAALRDVSEVPSAIADALQTTIAGDADPDSALAALLRGRRSLLVLDNAEHLPGLAALLGRMLMTAPELRWLVTSQAALNTRAETVVRLGPLEVPFAPKRSADELEVVPAAALFLERVRARVPGYELAAADRAPLVELCHQLEGMPLALELAAARVPMLGLGKLVDSIAAYGAHALGRGSDDLPARHRGLHAALDWTVSLLDEFEREVYAACAAFAQAWTIEDMEQMFVDAADPSQVWDSLARLLDLSLVVQRGDGRFTMPERVRRHSAEVLAASNREHERRIRHAEVVGQRVRALMLVREGNWDRVVADLGDLVEETLHALAWTAAHDRVSYRLLLAAASWPLYTYGQIGPFVQDVVDFARSGTPADLAQGRLCAEAASRVAGVELNLDERWSLLEQAIACLDSHGLLVDQLYALGVKLTLLAQRGDFDAARAVIDRRIAMARKAGDDALVEASEHLYPWLDLEAGDFVSAEQGFERILSKPHRSTYVSSAIPTYLGDCAFGRGAFRSAIGHWSDFLGGLATSHLLDVLLQIYAIGGACARLSCDAEAVELGAACANTFEARTGRPWADVALDWLEDPLTEAGQRLSRDALRDARQRGVHLGYDELIARTLEIAAEVTG